MIRVGTAGWQVPRPSADRFSPAPSQLERYATRFTAVEINSSFYRPHRPQTYARWAAATPESFRFAVKLRRTLTHERRLRDCGDLLAAFLQEIAPLGERLGPLLVQLPPSLAFEAATAEAFFADLRRRHAGPVACEPRHPTWFAPAAESLLGAHRIARVAADPACVPAAAEPGGWPDLLYVRLHGSPRAYFSPYPPAELERWAKRLVQSLAAERWCVLDNTGSGAAAGDALDLQARLRAPPPQAMAAAT
jgi:uncharacterized protein YecE (DUF72 family)